MASALLAGGTGLIGGFVLEQLLASARYDRIVMVARKPIAKAHEKLDCIVADGASILDAELPSIDDVFCCLGTTIKTAGSKAAFRAVDFQYVMDVANQSRKAGAKQFLLVSSLGAAADSSVFYNQVKGESEDALQAMDWPALQIFRPSLLLGPRAEFRFAEKMGQPLACLFSPLLMGRARRYRPVQAEAVASKMVDIAAKDLAGTHFHYFHEL